MPMTVERVSYLHATTINEFLNTIQHTFHPGVDHEALEIRRAVALVRNNAVGSYTYASSEDDITVTVQGTKPEQVHIFFGRMSATCTCGAPDWCSHRVAVIFHLYLQFHSLTDWLHEWRRSESQQMALTISERTPAAWDDVLSRLTGRLRTIEFAENPGIFIHECSLIEQKMTPLLPFEYEWKPLFGLYYRLHLLGAAWPYITAHLASDSSSFVHGKWYLKNWLTEQLDKLNDNVTAIGAKPKLFEADVFHEHLKDLVRNFTLNNSGLFNSRFRVYLLFWQQLFPNATARASEQEQLSNENTEEAKLLMALFHLLQGDYDELEKMANALTADHIDMWLPLADLAESDDDIDALAIILQALVPFTGDYVNHKVTTANRPAFIRKMDGLLEAADFPEDTRERLFAHYGEAGIDVYADFLVERERFTEWGALMHRYNVSYDEAEAGGLKVALSKDPAAVMPLLHTYAMRFITEKNRYSYRRAVKLFKKMKIGSKKSGKIDFWNLYIDKVREKNRRLRALMEEMEKGNLNL